MRNLHEQVKKAFCYQKLFWPFTVWINCSSDLKIFATSQPSASYFKSFSRSLEQSFLTAGQNNFGNKIPFINKVTSATSASLARRPLFITVTVKVRTSGGISSRSKVSSKTGSWPAFTLVRATFTYKKKYSFRFILS